MHSQFLGGFAAAAAVCSQNPVNELCFGFLQTGICCGRFRGNSFDLAEKITAIAGSGRYEYAPFTAERKALEPGDYWADITKIKSVVKWQPQVSLEEGLRCTVEYYRRYRDHYWGGVVR